MTQESNTVQRGTKQTTSTLEEKLAQFIPELHGGEAIPSSPFDETPAGAPRSIDLAEASSSKLARP